MANYTAFLFDLDGTLIDSKVDLTNAVNYVLRALGFPKQSMADVMSRVGGGLKDLLRDSLGVSDPTTLAEARRHFNSYYLAHCVDATDVYPGVVETLEHLAPLHKLGVVTNKPKIFADKILSCLDLTRFFPVVIGGDSLPQMKPHPAPVAKAVKDLNIDTTKGVMLVGDGVQDILAAQAAGTKVCVATYGFGYHETHSNLRPDFKIKTFEDLKEIAK